MSDETDAGAIIHSEECYYCGKLLVGPSPTTLNVALVRHGMDEHKWELRNERRRSSGTFDPIRVADIIREGPQ